jgi:aerobic carbon-monoxide dehydrogenase medium subunit
VKPAPFEYVAPRSLDEAVRALRDNNGQTRLLAGGQSLVPLLNFRLAQPERLVDLNRVPELNFVESRDGGLAIGAMTRDAALERDARIATRYPLLADALGWIGHPAIRSRGTLGGSLAHADPAAELPAVAVCLDARLSIQGPRGRRSVNATDFFVGYLTTVLEPNEILSEVWLPPPIAGAGHAWVEFARRHGDFALVGVAVTLILDDEQVIDARIVLAGVAGRPFRAREAETLLVGSTVHERAKAAAEAIGGAIEPEADIHASREYRTHLAVVLAERAIRQAHQRALASAPAALDVRRALGQLERYA